jgi:hypothetical protein
MTDSTIHNRGIPTPRQFGWQHLSRQLCRMITCIYRYWWLGHHFRHRWRWNRKSVRLATPGKMFTFSKFLPSIPF